MEMRAGRREVHSSSSLLIIIIPSSGLPGQVSELISFLMDQTSSQPGLALCETPALV